MVLAHPIIYDRVKLPASNRSVRPSPWAGSVRWHGWHGDGPGGATRPRPPASPLGSGFTFGLGTALGRYT